MLRLPYIVVLLSLSLAGTVAYAQPEPGRRNPDTSAARTGDSVRQRPWYDTLKITRPRYAYASPRDRLALAAFTAISIPVGIGVSVLTILPPSLNVLMENGTSHTGFAFSTGVGITSDTTAAIFFPDYRIQLEGGYYFQRERRGIVRASFNMDKPLVQVDRRGFFWLGIAGGAGLSTDFGSVSPYAEGWIGLINPMGIRFLTLFPMHNYGLRGRVGYDPATRRSWYEISLAATSTFWF